MIVKFENSTRLPGRFKCALKAPPQFFIFHFSLFIIHFNKAVRYEDLNGWVGGKRRTRNARFRAARGNVFTIRKKKDGGGRAARERKFI